MCSVCVSILGPLFFIIYVNDLHCATDLFRFIFYADNSTLYTSLDELGACPNQMNEQMNNKWNQQLTTGNGEWLKANKLASTVMKTKYMIFSRPELQVSPIMLEIENNVIDRVEKFNFLGLEISENLDWSSHTDKLSLN